MRRLTQATWNPERVSTAPLIQVRNVTRRFGHVVALRDANFVAHAGEVSALVGDNGAGKSTLIKILSGALQHDSGEILLERSEERRVGKECA